MVFLTSAFVAFYPAIFRAALNKHESIGEEKFSLIFWSIDWFSDHSRFAAHNDSPCSDDVTKNYTFVHIQTHLRDVVLWHLRGLIFRLVNLFDFLEMGSSSDCLIVHRDLIFPLALSSFLLSQKKNTDLCGLVVVKLTDIFMLFLRDKLAYLLSAIPTCNYSFWVR